MQSMVEPGCWWANQREAGPTVQTAMSRSSSSTRQMLIGRRSKGSWEQPHRTWRNCPGATSRATGPARARHDNDRLGDVALGAPELRSVENVVGAVLARRGAEARGVGAGARLREAERADRAPRGERRDVFLLLSLVAEQRKNDLRKAGHRHADGVGHARAGELFDRGRVLAVAESGPAVFLRNRNSRQSQLAQLRDDLGPEPLLALVFLLSPDD